MVLKEIPVYKNKTEGKPTIITEDCILETTAFGIRGNISLIRSLLAFPPERVELITTTNVGHNVDTQTYTQERINEQDLWLRPRLSERLRGITHKKIVYEKPI